MPLNLRLLRKLVPTTLRCFTGGLAGWIWRLSSDSHVDCGTLCPELCPLWVRSSSSRPKLIADLFQKLAPQAGFAPSHDEPKASRAMPGDSLGCHFAKGEIGSSGWIRTSNPPVNSR